MTSSVLFSAPVAHHQKKFTNLYLMENEVRIEDISKRKSQTFSGRLSSIIRNKQVTESIDCTDLSEEAKLIPEEVLNGNESSNISDKCSSESSRASSNNDQNNDCNSEQFNNSVSSTSSISNQCQSTNSKSQKLKKKY